MTYHLSCYTAETIACIYCLIFQEKLDTLSKHLEVEFPESNERTHTSWANS